MGFKEYAVKKAVSLILTVYIIITLNFFLFRIMPGDPAAMMVADPRIPPEMREFVIKRFGLDKPLWEQYFIYIRELFRGNFGISFWKAEPVFSVIVKRIPNTLILLSFAFVISAVVGVLLGAVSGWRRGSKLDVFIVASSLTTYTIPSFWTGLLLLLIFGYKLGLFPLGGTISPGVPPVPLLRFKDYLWHMVLPSITLFFYYTGGYVILMRSSMLDVLAEDFIVTAWAKGLREFKIMREHAMRNALLPVVTVIAINLGWLLSGVVEIEVVFAWPGLGKLIYDAIMQRDYPLLQGAFFMIAVSVVLANFLADLIYGVLDPRIRRGVG